MMFEQVENDGLGRIDFPCIGGRGAWGCMPGGKIAGKAGERSG